jgi:hypothetical protein
VIAALLRAAPRQARSVAVRLVGVVPRHQGTHDSLCAYYAGATLLCALHPWMPPAFDGADPAHDPIFGALPRRGRSIQHVVSSVLFTGLHLEHLASAMDRAVPGTRFRYRVRRRGHLADVVTPVLAGLPVLLGWEGPEIGNHTVVVVGVRATRGTRRTWLEVADPSGMFDQVEWDQLLQLGGGRVEVIDCTEHAGTRPDRAVVARDGAGRLLPRHCRVERLDPRDLSWTRLTPP